MAPDHEKNSFRRGVMALVILGLLEKENMYGYQLVQETVLLCRCVFVKMRKTKRTHFYINVDFASFACYHNLSIHP